MSNNSSMNNFGEQMKGALNDALTTGNYNKLKFVVADTVSNVLSEAGATASNAWQQQEERLKQREMREKEAREREARAYQERQVQMQRQRNAMAAQQNYRRTGLIVDVKNKGLAAGILLVVFGALANIPLFILTLIGAVFRWGATGSLGFFLLVSIFFISHGKNKIQLISRAKRYVKLCGSKMYAGVEELASQVGISPKRVAKDLRRILQKGIIPSAHMDKQGTHLMLNDVTYRQYLEAEKAREIREKEEKETTKLKAKQTKEIETEKKVQVKEETPKTELEQMIQEGQTYIQKLRYMNDLIPGEVISSKLDRLENLLKEIFQRVQKEPAQMNRMHKVMSYYLPTTLKLVEAYHEFDVVSSPNEEILKAKKEIEETMDTINEAFVELLNSLFQDKVFDVTTDAQVLQTMLANEGLTKDIDFAKTND